MGLKVLKSSQQLNLESPLRQNLGCYRQMQVMQESIMTVSISLDLMADDEVLLQLKCSSNYKLTLFMFLLGFVYLAKNEVYHIKMK